MAIPFKKDQTENGSSVLKKMVKIMACALVDQPEAVSVSEINGTHSLIIELSVAKADLGKIIGKHGRNADALRTIVGAVSTKIGKRTVLEIIE